MSLIRRALASSCRTFHRTLFPPAGLRHGLALAAVLALAGPAGALINTVTVSPTHFSPNGDGARDEAVIRWSTDAAPESIRVVIQHASLGLQRVVGFGPRPAGADSVVWDGRDSVGTIAPEGIYLIRIEQYSAVGGDVDVTGNAVGLTLDTTPPPAPAYDDFWIDRDVTTATITIDGTAPRADSVTIHLGGEPIGTVRVAQADSSFKLDVALREGTNTFALQSFDLSRNHSVLTPAITITYRNTADVLIFAARPVRFSPNGDGVIDSTIVQARLDAPTTRLLIQAHPAKPPLTGVFVDTLQTIRTLYDAPADSGDHFVAWDGRDSTGALVADGLWYFTARAESAGVAGEPILPFPFRSTAVTVDNTAPPVPVPNPPPPESTTRNFVVFSGRMTGTALPTDSVLVWRGDALVAAVSGQTWSIEASLALGTNVFTLQGADVAGNRSARSAPFVVVYHEPLGFHAPERFRATDVFDVNVTQTARSVRLDLYELSGRRVRTLLVNRIDQRYELPWDLLDDAGRTVGDGPYVARVTVTYDDGRVEAKNGAIVVAK